MAGKTHQPTGGSSSWTRSAQVAADALVPCPTRPSPPRHRSFYARAWFEVYLSWRFIRSNFPPSVLFPVVVAVSAWHHADAPGSTLPIALAEALVYGWLFVYLHELPNQVVGVAEDAINKPHRPIPSGLCTPHDARRRIAPVAVLFLAAAVIVGVPVWGAAFLVTVVLYHRGGHLWWPTKSLMPMIGAAVVMAGAWVAGAGTLTPAAWWWIVAGAAYWIPVCVLQDLRDVAGDSRIGRRTLPMVIGDRANRAVGAGMLAMLPATMAIPLWQWIPRVPLPLIGAAALQIIFTAGCAFLAWRLLTHRTRAGDDLTYKIYAALFCVLALGPLTT